MYAVPTPPHTLLFGQLKSSYELRLYCCISCGLKIKHILSCSDLAIQQCIDRNLYLAATISKIGPSTIDLAIKRQKIFFKNKIGRILRLIFIVGIDFFLKCYNKYMV